MLKAFYWHTPVRSKTLPSEIFRSGQVIRKGRSYIFLSLTGALYFFSSDLALVKKSFVFYDCERLTSVTSSHHPVLRGRYRTTRQLREIRLSWARN
ncbi:MAG: hypothetical protein P4M11_15525 [Candidatus Pacebacteria bacterium]|nr:hypothetical protein [Candidatus Paceibacterota bacterium]